MKLILFFLLTLLNETCSIQSNFFKIDKEKSVRIERKRREVISVETDKEEDDYTLKLSKSRILYQSQNELIIIDEFSVDEKKMFGQCELISLPINFFTRYLAPNGSQILTSVFGYLNLNTIGAHSDEIVKKAVIHKSFDCMSIKRFYVNEKSILLFVHERQALVFTTDIESSIKLMLYDQGYYYKYITYILGFYKEDSDSVDFIEVYKVGISSYMFFMLILSFFSSTRGWMRFYRKLTSLITEEIAENVKGGRKSEEKREEQKDEPFKEKAKRKTN